MIFLSHGIVILISFFSAAGRAAPRGAPLLIYDTLSETEGKLNQTILSTLNAFRSQHDAPALVWNDTLYADALAIAQVACPIVGPNHIRDNEGIRSERIECTDNNIAAKGYTNQAIAYITECYNTCTSYSNRTHAGGDLFTKMVWRATTDVACAWSPEPREANLGSHQPPDSNLFAYVTLMAMLKESTQQMSTYRIFMGQDPWVNGEAEMITFRQVAV